VDPLYQIQKIVQRHLQLGLRSAKCLTLIYISSKQMKINTLSLILYRLSQLLSYHIVFLFFVCACMCVCMGHVA